MNMDLKTRLVFIDTSAFESKNFQFGEHALEKLEAHLEKEHLHLLITSITINEILAHMEEKSKQARALIKKLQKDAMFLRNVPELPCFGIFEKITSEEVFSLSKKKFEEFLDCESIEVVDLSTVDVTHVFKTYFGSLPPFGGADKKSEFPDAFALEAVKNTAESRGHDLYIVSSDKDMKKYVENKENLHYLEKIDDLLDLVIRTEEQLSEPAKLAESVGSIISDDIVNRIRGIMEDAEFYSDDIDGFEDEIFEVKIGEVALKHKNIVDASREGATFEVEFSAEIEAHYSITDYDRSPWDPEDKEYVFVLHNTIVKKHIEWYSCYVTVNLHDGLTSNAEVEDIEFDFTGFDLSDDNSEVISYKEYDINGE